MDLLGRAIRGRLDANVVRIPGRAVRERAHPHRLPGARDVRLGQKRIQPLVGGLHLRRVGCHRGGRESFLLARGNVRWEAREHHEDGALQWIRSEQPLYLRRHIAQRDARRSHLRVQPLAQEHDRLIDHGAEAVDARKDVLVVLDRRIRVQLDGLREQLRAGSCIDCQILAREACAGYRIVGAAPKEIVVELIALRERLAIDGRDRGEWRLQLILAPGDRFQ